MSNAHLLVELVTEELPPKALPHLGAAFTRGIVDGLRACGLAPTDGEVRSFAAPRRLAVMLKEVATQAASREVTEKIMPVKVALDAEGQPTQPLLKKLAAKGIPVEAIADFERRMDGKAEALFHTRIEKGAELDEVLADIVHDAVRALPIPKLMRWGASDVQFVRPVHRLVMLHGERVVPGKVLGLDAGRTTQGHRFMSRGAIDIPNAEAWEPTLLAEGKVVPSFDERRAEIERQLKDAAAQENASLGDYLDLLDEVTALVEHPSVYKAEFEAEFLAVPQECLILTMRSDQKYFPLFDDAGTLLNRFLIVSNMRVADPSNIIAGNQRVVRPRLADARFFFEQDCRKTLESRVEGLAKVVYHNKLGSQLERVERVRAIGGKIAEKLGVDAAAVDQVARLAKADLLTDMVGEFPELQGVMGRYYALHDGLSDVVADAIEDHYKPRFAGDDLPRNDVGVVVALADKLETLVGLFGIGQLPTGDKDPFALRRHALGVIRMLVEREWALDMDDLIDTAAAPFGGIDASHRAALVSFIYDRLANALRDQGYSAQEVDAVLALQPQRLADVIRRLAAVRAFAALQEAPALAAANKRVGNILKKASGEVAQEVDVALFSESAETALNDALGTVVPQADAAFERGDYSASLQALAALKTPIDAFFDAVMVNTDDPALRGNRLGLLATLHRAMNRVADLSRLSA
ncbi:MAG TPA: glycine--tRNA ligase subunit beta [Azoarcus sp.]|nr:glycine--tRNA ligase subunit beta [Azoarcus sp.]